MVAVRVIAIGTAQVLVQGGKAAESSCGVYRKTFVFPSEVM